jgi:hypothetical protein
MKSIRWLEAEIKETRSTLNDAEQSLATLSNISNKLGVEAVKSQLRQLETELQTLYVLRGKEVVEFHLSGGEIENGGVPLDLLGRIAIDVSSSIHDAVAKIKGRRRITKVLSDALDLRLAGIYSGSARLMITGRSEVDLFGKSPLTDALEGTFGLLTARSPEEIMNSVSTVGVSSSRRFSQMLVHLSNNNIETEIKWNSPEDERFVWTGKKDDIVKLASTLESITALPPVKLTISGVIETISGHKPFEIRSGEVDYTFEVDEEIRRNLKEGRFHLDQPVILSVEKQEYENTITGQRKTKYNLLKVEKEGLLVATQHLIDTPPPRELGPGE